MRLLATILFIFICSVAFTQPKHYYVSTSTGNDANSALQATSQASPWASVAKISSFFSSLNAGDTVSFKAGETFFGTLTATKSGTSAAPIVFNTYGGTPKAKISGFFSVPSWTSLGANKYSAIVSSAQTTLNMLLVNGNFQALGRFPKLNQSTTSWSTGGYFQFQSFSGTTSITSNQIGAAPNFVGGEVAIRVGHFNINRGTISNQTANTVTYTIIPSQPQEAMIANYGFFFQNHPNACTQQGDWAYTASTKTVTIFSTTTPTGIQVSVNQNNVNIGANSFLSFSNLSFVGANTNAFAITSGKSIKIQNSNIFFAGVNAVTTASGGSTQSLLTDSITYINNNVLDCNFSGGHTVDQNFINHVGDIAGMGQTGDVNGMVTSNPTTGTVVTNNVIKNIGFNAIQMNGTASSFTVRRNFIDSVCINKDDGGGIYSFHSTVVGSKIIDQNFVFHAVGAPQGTPGSAGGDGHGLYLDNNDLSVTMTNNVAAFCHGAGLRLNDPANNIIRNNLAYDNSSGQTHVFSFAGSNATIISNFRSNILCSKATNVPTIEWVNTQNGTLTTWFPSANSSDSNVFARPINATANIQFQSTSSGTVTLSGWQALAVAGANQDQHSKISPRTIPDTTVNNIRFIYDSSLTTPKTFSLNGSWVDLRGVSFIGSITLQPMTATVLLFVSGAGSPLAATATAAVNPLTCVNQTTQVVVNASGGTAPYKYKLGSGSFVTTNTFTGLGAGTYVFTIQDVALATVTAQVTIVQPTQITITESNPAITINGQLITITINASGGNAGSYTYSLDGVNFQTSNVFANKGAGTYTATVRDSKLCSNTFTFTITQPALLTLGLSAVTNPLKCFGDTTTLIATAAGGTLPYSYRVNGGTPQSSNQFHGLIAGTYQVTVTDFAGAVTTQTLVITQALQILITENHTAILVNLGTSTVTFTATNGVNPKTYILDGVSQSSNVFTGIVAGTHQVIVRGSNGCQNTLTFTITQPQNLIVSASITSPITCNGLSNGQITGNASGGTVPYDYQLNNGTRQSSPIFSGLSAGTYTLTVHDGGGAVVSASPITLTQPSPILISLAYSSAPTTLVVTISSGGVAPFTYKLDAGPPQSGNTFLNVSANNHTILVTDNNGCTVSQQFTVGSTLALTLSIRAIACNGDKTSATVIPAGGTFPYNFLWSDGRQVSTNPNITAGTWSVRVGDNAGHFHDTTFVVIQPPTVTISLSIGTIAFNGGTAAVTVTAGGGSGSGYTYSLDSASFQGSNSYPTVSAGNHFMLVKDGNGCVKRQDFSMSQPGALVITISRGAAPTCAGQTQTITVGSIGGSGTVTGTGAFPTSAGTVTFSIHDQFSTADTIITVSAPLPILVAVNFTTIVVNGNSSTVTVTASQGTGSLQYSLDGGAYQPSNVFAGVLAGPHFVTVKDANNCTKRNDFSIPQPDALSMTATPVANPFLCYGDTTSIALTKSGGTAPFTYGINGTFGSSPNFHGLPAGTYKLSVRDAFNAQHDTIINILQPPLITLTQVITDTIFVYGGTANVKILSAGGTPFSDSLYQYKLDAGSFTLSDSAFSFTFTSVTGGNHTVTIKDANGCTNQFSFFMPQPNPPVQYNTKRLNRRRIFWPG